MTDYLLLEPTGGAARIALTRMLATPAFHQSVDQVLCDWHAAAEKTKNPSARHSGDGFEIYRNG
jgi:hypothetical protein